MALFSAAKQDILAEKVKAVQAAEKRQTNLGAKHDYLVKGMQAAIDKRVAISNGLEDGTSTTATWDAADAEVKRLQKELAQCADQITATANELTNARRELYAAGEANRRKDAEKLGDQRLKAAEKFQRAAELMLEAQTDLFAINEKLVVWGGVALQMQHGGTLISKGELLEAFGTELARVSNVQPLTNQIGLLGAKKYIMGGDPSKELPLMDAIKLANEKMVEVVANGPEPVEPAKPKVPPPVDEYTPAHSPLNIAGTLTAEQAAAQLGPRKRSLG